MIQLIHGHCLEKMKDIPDASIDLTVTSPPYDNLRTYNGNNDQWGEHVWKQCIKELFRVTKFGGVVVWIVSDSTFDGSETGTSFKQALWAKDCGFNIETMIWIKDQMAHPTTNRYYNAFEFMFLFIKGMPKTFNPIEDRLNKSVGRRGQSMTVRQKDGSLKNKLQTGKKIKPYGVRWNYWLIYNQKRTGIENRHPAVFPEKLAHDHIISWSNKGDTVLDPFMGSGTTAKMAKLLRRNFIGIELDAEYFKLAERRIAAVNAIPNEIDWGE